MHPVFERIKDNNTYESEREFLNYVGVTYTFRYDEDSKGIYACDQGGFLLEPKEAKELFEALQVFFSAHGENWVTEFNQKKLNREDKQEKNPSLNKPRVKEKHPGTVYFLKAANGLYKIGITTDLKTRMASFRNGPVAIELLHSFEADNRLEAETKLHDYFAAYRRNGEWFELPENYVEKVPYIIGYKNKTFLFRQEV